MLRHGKYENTQIKFLEMKTITSEMKHTLNRIKSKLDTAEDKVSKLLDTFKESVKN